LNIDVPSASKDAEDNGNESKDGKTAENAAQNAADADAEEVDWGDIANHSIDYDTWYSDGVLDKYIEPLSRPLYDPKPRKTEVYCISFMLTCL
jgi:hypothetical protein